ncbi:MAG: TRAP transporter large permease subunit [Deltaproteobacteria bacterium]
MEAERPGSSPRGSVVDRVENGISVAVLCGMALLPLLEIVGRRLWRTGVPGSNALVQHATLWIGFLGAAISARDDRLLSLGAVVGLLPRRFRAAASLFASSVSVSVSILLCLAGLSLVRVEYADGQVLLPHLPLWAAEAVIPAGFALAAGRILKASSGSWAARGAVALLAAGGVWAVSSEWILRGTPFAASLAILAAAVILGAPIFVALGGLAVLFFRHAEVPVAAIPAEMYRLVTSPTLPTLPLFTFAGYLLTAGNASGRLVRLFRALVGWMPGAIAVVAVLVCAFFTTFTGASGVTIIALGGILLPALLSERFPERFSVGLLTSAGSLGLLFPPCLPVILYAVVGGIPVNRMFLGGFLPGVLLVVLVSAWAVRTGRFSGSRKTPFSLRELGGAAWEAKWEILLPVIVLLGIFGGFATTVEAAAMTVLYAFCVETFVTRDLSVRRDLLRVGTESATLIGGVLIILAAAMGLTSYMVDAGIPDAILSWVTSTIHSRILFLAVLNLVLLVVGSLMDIFSAIVVVVPVIAPLAAVFRIDPVHLGVIFLANLQLGYLTPPVGMNLFLSAYRFDRPLGEIYRSVIPFFLILLLGVVAITYVPVLTTALLPG